MLGRMQAQEGKERQVPEWEHEAARSDYGQGEANAKAQRTSAIGLKGKLDSMLPPHRTYLGLRRNVFLWALAVAVVCLLVLTIGLAVGLSKQSK